ncbi:MAG TPA: adenylate/guanylate cyclase domain-containing protein, partial [Gammaproteobacteria bacterium]
MSNRILSVMFTDIQGYTARTSAQSRDATLQLLKRHRDLLLPVLARYGGRLVKGIGDAFLVTFDSPTDAVLAGIAVQETLAAHNAGVPDAQQLRIRVAIHTGEVLLAEDDVYGEAVNIAARIEGIAEPGEVYFTEATYLSMNRAEVPSAEIGYRILKGIP